MLMLRAMMDEFPQLALDGTFQPVVAVAIGEGGE
jgi:hypothetical protein